MELCTSSLQYQSSFSSRNVLRYRLIEITAGNQEISECFLFFIRHQGGRSRRRRNREGCSWFDIHGCSFELHMRRFGWMDCQFDPDITMCVYPRTHVNIRTMI